MSNLSPAAILYDTSGTEKGTAGNPVKTDPTGTTSQPITATALPLPSGAATSTIQTDGTQKTQVTSLPSIPTGSNTIGKVDQGTGGSSAWKTDGSSFTQPISATALPLPTGAATSALQTQPGVDIGDVTVNNGSGAAAVNIQDGGNSITVDGPLTDTQLRNTAVPVSVSSLPLPSGAATETTLSGVATSANQTNGTQKAIVRGGAKGATVAADVTSESVDANRQALHVKVVGGGGSAVDSNVNIVDPSGNALSVDEDLSPTSTRGLMISGWAEGTNTGHRISVDASGRIVIAPAGTTSSAKGFSFGDINLSAAATTAALRRTTYTEQTSNAQRSIVSANANDTAAGTGARTVKITYITATGTGPFTETITLNGTTPVNTVATNICYIEKIEVVTAGSSGSNTGIISLKAATAGGGATIWTIGATDNITYGAHHYVPTGITSYITSMSVTINGGSALFFLRAYLYTISGSIDKQISDYVRAATQSATGTRNYGTPIAVPGPARITAYVTTEANTNLWYRAAFDYYDQAS